MKDNTKAKVTACLLTMMAPTIAPHAYADGLQIMDTAIWTDTEIVKPNTKHAKTGKLGKKVVCSATKDGKTLTADSLADLLRQVGYSKDEKWGKTDKLTWAWFRVRNAKFKRGEPVEVEGWTYIKFKNSI